MFFIFLHSLHIKPLLATRVPVVHVVADAGWYLVSHFPEELTEENKERWVAAHHVPDEFLSFEGQTSKKKPSSHLSFWESDVFFFSAFRVFHLLFVTHKEKNNSRVSAHTGERGNLRAGGKCNSFCGPAVGVLKGFQKAGEWTERCRNYSVFFCGFGTKTQFGTDWKIELWGADSRTDLSTVSRGPNKIKEDT